MDRKPLRLGTSTSAFISCMPENTCNSVYWNTDFTESEYKAAESACSGLADAFAGSQIQSLEYFLTRPMLSLGNRHPMAVQFEKLANKCEIWSVHAPFDNVDIASLDESFRRESVEQMCLAADFAYRFNAKVMTIHPGLEIPNAGPKPERIKASGKSLGEIAQHCSGIGVRPAIEMLPRQCIGNSAEELAAILDYANNPIAGICLDSNHFFPAVKLPEVVRIFGDRLLTLHISDHDDTDEKHWFPMKGVIDWPVFIGSLRENGYTGPFMYEISPEEMDIDKTIASIQTNYNELMR